MENISRVLQKQKQKKLHGEIELNNSSYITQFKIEFLLPFTGCGKVLGKMPDSIFSQHSEINIVNIGIIVK